MEGVDSVCREEISRYVLVVFDSEMYEESLIHMTHFTGIGEGWARGVLGGSTGGWESLAYAVFYPEKINYAAVACPDPVSFTQFVTTNIYRDKNMFYYDSPFKRTLKPRYSRLVQWPRRASRNLHSDLR